MPTTQKTETPTKKPLDRIADRFDAVGTELRNRARLAGDEAKRAWDRAHLERVTDEVKRAREEAQLQLHLASLDARDAFRETEKRIDALRDAAGVGIDHLAEDLSKQIHRFAETLRSAGKAAKADAAPTQPTPKAKS